MRRDDEHGVRTTLGRRPVARDHAARGLARPCRRSAAVSSAIVLRARAPRGAAAPLRRAAPLRPWSRRRRCRAAPPRDARGRSPRTPRRPARPSRVERRDDRREDAAQRRSLAEEVEAPPPCVSRPCRCRPPALAGAAAGTACRRRSGCRGACAATPPCENIRILSSKSDGLRRRRHRRLERHLARSCTQVGQMLVERLHAVLVAALGDVVADLADALAVEQSCRAPPA